MIDEHRESELRREVCMQWKSPEKHMNFIIPKEKRHAHRDMKPSLSNHLDAEPLSRLHGKVRI